MTDELTKELIRRAELSLNTMHKWVERADQRFRFLLAINIAMVGVASTNMRFIERTEEASDAVILLVVIFSISLVCLLVSAFPRIRSPNDSLIFFSTIIKVEHDRFAKNFRAESYSDYLDDLLEQIHVNARIANFKFFMIQLSLVPTFLGIFAWALYLYLTNTG